MNDLQQAIEKNNNNLNESENFDAKAQEIAAHFAKIILTELPIEIQLKTLQLANDILSTKYRVAIENAEDDLKGVQKAFDRFLNKGE